MEIDGTPGVALEAGVEEAGRVLQRGALGEGHLYDILVRLTGADHSGVRPYRNPSPLPPLDHFGVGLLDENSDPSERLAPPITQLLDSRIYQLRGRVSSFSFLRAALPLARTYCASSPLGLNAAARFRASAILVASRNNSISLTGAAPASGRSGLPAVPIGTLLSHRAAGTFRHRGAYPGQAAPRRYPAPR